jgi:hypothetical protein
MKQTFLLAALSASLFTASTTQAQLPGVHKVAKALPKVTVGLKLGANFQTLDGDGQVFVNSYKGGVAGGAFVGVTKNKIGVQVEGIVKTVKYSVSDAIKSAGGNDINTVYLDVPVLFEYKIVNRLWVQAGPQFSALLSAKSDNKDVKSTFNTSDFSVVAGLQALLPLHIVVGARYLYGFSDMNNSANSGLTNALHNRSAQVYVGWRFL